MKKISLLVSQLVATLALMIATVVPAGPVAAHHCFGHAGTASGLSIADCADAGACLDTGGAGCPAQANAEDRVNDTIRLVINIFSFIVGVVAVIMVIIGGFKYITSAGDSTNIASAKNTILYAIVGLIIVALAQVIVRFVLRQTTGPVTALTSLIG